MLEKWCWTCIQNISHAFLLEAKIFKEVSTLDLLFVCLFSYSLVPEIQYICHGGTKRLDLKSED